MEGSTSSLPEIHPEVVAFVLDQLNEDERSEFLDGLRPIAHTAVDTLLTSKTERAGVERLFTELLEYLESWRLSLTLAQNGRWLDQIDDSEREWDAGDRQFGTIQELADKLAS